MSRQVGRVNQQSKGETPLRSGVLQRAAVRAVADKEVEATEDVESGTLRESRFRHDFSQVQIDRSGRQKEVSKTPKQTGLPDHLKAGVENLSGYSLDDVRVHYNSPKPAQLQALAYTQGTEIHVTPGQEEHLPHEAWHVVQQMQGRVKPTKPMKGEQINDDERLEREADVMGERANKQVRDISYLDSMTPNPVVSTRSDNGQKATIMQFYIDGYTPDLTNLTIPGGGVAAYNGVTFSRPNGWYDGTHDELFRMASEANQVRNVRVPGYPTVTLVECAVSHTLGAIEDMDIGHTENWESYVADKEPDTVREATSAYNDLNNLRLEKPGANRSHDYEDGRESEGEDEDVDGEMDDFIVDDSITD